METLHRQAGRVSVLEAQNEELNNQIRDLRLVLTTQPPPTTPSQLASILGTPICADSRPTSQYRVNRCSRIPSHSKCRVDEGLSHDRQVEEEEESEKN